MGGGSRAIARIVGILCLGWMTACSSSNAPPPDRNDGPEQSGPPASCVPTSCAAEGKNCGIISDHCGGTLHCGECSGSDTCGGGGANVCGQAACEPTSCRAQEKNCGVVADGCGGTLDCGTCSGADTCGGGGQPNVCGATCVPMTCEAAGANCGSISDGCGGTLECGACGLGTVCGAGNVPNVCALPPAPACADFALGSALPAALEAELPVVAEDRHTNPCGYDRATYEVLVAWTAPEDGVFVIDTARSTFDTVLTVRDGTCEGSPLVCADNGIHYGNASVATVELQAGKTILIAVDGATGEGNFVQLHINRLEATEAQSCEDDADNDGDGRVDCWDSDCAQASVCLAQACTEDALPPELPVTEYLDRPSVNGMFGTCGGEHSPDHAFRFTAPATATYRFRAHATEENAVPPVLYLHDNCRGRELACSAGPAVEKVLDVPLSEGQTTIIVVDGFSASELTVELAPAAATAP